MLMTVLISYIPLMLLLVPLICSINKSIMLVPAVLAVCLLVCVCVCHHGDTFYFFVLSSQTQSFFVCLLFGDSAYFNLTNIAKKYYFENKIHF